VLNELPRPVVFAHRGASSIAPENTLAAFQLAADLGADAIELDVKLTADEVPVVIHDPNVDRTTNGTGRIADLSFTALRELDAGSFMSEKFHGEPIPTLEEVFEAVGQRLLINVELTNYTTPRDDLVEKVVALVKRHNMQERVIFSSFFPGNLNKAAKSLPETPCGLLTLKGWPGWPGRTIGYTRKFYAALHPYQTDLNAHLIKRVHQKGKRVNVWTVNAEGEMKRLQLLGVDGIITDEIQLAKNLFGGAT
jgi:glycerophosphoryl diester phosphodiesterase